MVSRMPPVSPASTMLVYKSSKGLGYCRRAFAKVEPPSTEDRTPISIRAKALFSCWAPRISRLWTSGRPASIITESWRVKIARSFGFTLARDFGAAA